MGSSSALEKEKKTLNLQIRLPQIYLEENLPILGVGSRGSSSQVAAQMLVAGVWRGFWWRLWDSRVGSSCGLHQLLGCRARGRGRKEMLSSATSWSHAAQPTLCLHKAPSLEMRSWCKQKCVLKPRGTWGLWFSALQELHFIHCHCERFLLYSKSWIRASLDCRS